MRGDWDLEAYLKCLGDAREDGMFKPIKTVESKWSGGGPHGFLCGMGFHSVIQNEEDCLRSVAVEAGC